MMKKWKSNGVMLGIESLGGKVVKITDTHLYLEVKENSDLNNNETLKRTQSLIKEMTGLKIKYKVV